MTKTLVLKATVVLASIYLLAQSTFNINDNRIIIVMVLDTIYKDKPQPRSAFIGEQVFFSLDQFFSLGYHKEKENPMSLLFQGDWKYLTQMVGKKYSKKWKKISFDDVKDSRYNISAKNEVRFSPVLYSLNGKHAFVVYTNVANNVTQSTVFFFFEKMQGRWIHKGHYVPYFD